MKHLVPASSAGCSNGIHSVFAAPPVDSAVDFFLTSSSLSLVLHHGVMMSFLASKASMKPSQDVRETMFSSRIFLARSNMSFWICSHNSEHRLVKSSILTVSFSRVSRLAITHVPVSKSRAPNSTRIGTPFSSQWLYFQPGV